MSGGVRDGRAADPGAGDRRHADRRPSSTATIGRVLEGGAGVCRSAGIPVAGGHTIDSVEAIYGLVALGLVHPKQVKRNADARPGDVLVLGKPLGVGVQSAAYSEEGQLDAGYAQMIATTTALTHAGAELAALAGVHALTDVTGFGLAGHALEMARGAGCECRSTGRRCRCWTACGRSQARVSSPSASGHAGPAMALVSLPAGFAAEDKALLTDPQTSGGLLVACAPGLAMRCSASSLAAGVRRRRGRRPRAFVGAALLERAGMSGQGATRPGRRPWA
ncbi:MAG: selenide, water dikinase SelD [Rubrivivax sp.]